jgi:hypothetical protein
MLVSSTIRKMADREASLIRLFSLSLTSTAFAWYATLPPRTEISWGDLEPKFHEHLFLGNTN